MSVALLGDFFPSAEACLRSAGLHDLVFAHEPCIEHTVQLPLGAQHALTIRSPVLAVLCVVGVLIGAGGAWSLRRSPAWARAFAFFMCMNLSALPCHIFLPRHTYAHSLSIGLDVGCTGASCLALVAACVGRQPPTTRGAGASRKQAQRPQPATPAEARTSALRSLLASVLAHPLTSATVVLLAIANNLYRWHTPPSPAWPWVNEALYLGTLLFGAVPCTAAFLLQGWAAATPRARAWSLLAWLGAVVGAIGPILDPLFCRFLGPGWNLVNQVFLGCDLAFLGVWGFLAGQPKEEEAPKQA